MKVDVEVARIIRTKFTVTGATSLEAAERFAVASMKDGLDDMHGYDPMEVVDSWGTEDEYTVEWSEPVQ